MYNTPLQTKLTVMPSAIESTDNTERDRAAAQDLAAKVLEKLETDSPLSDTEIYEHFFGNNPEYKTANDRRPALNQASTQIYQTLQEFGDPYQVYQLIERLTVDTDILTRDDQNNFAINTKTVKILNRWIGLITNEEESVFFEQLNLLDKQIGEAIREDRANGTQTPASTIIRDPKYNKIRSFFQGKDLFTIYREIAVINTVASRIQTPLLKAILEKIDIVCTNLEQLNKITSESTELESQFPLLNSPMEGRTTPSHALFVILKSRIPNEKKTQLLERMKNGQFGILFSRIGEVAEVIEKGEEALFKPFTPEQGYGQKVGLGGRYPKKGQPQPVTPNHLRWIYNSLNCTHPYDEVTLSSLRAKVSIDFIFDPACLSLAQTTNHSDRDVTLKRLIHDGNIEISFFELTQNF